MIKEENIRISITLPKEEVEVFDDFIKIFKDKKEMNSRSKMARIAINKLVQDFVEFCDGEANKTPGGAQNSEVN